VKYLRQYVRSCKNPEGARDGRRQKRPRPPDDEYEVEKMFDEEYASSILDAMDTNLDSLLHSPLVDDAMHGFPPMDEASFPKTPDAACVVSYHRLGRVIDCGLNTTQFTRSCSCINEQPCSRIVRLL